MSVYNLRRRGFELQLASLAASILATALVGGPAHAQSARNQVTISTPDGSDYNLTNNTAVDEDEVIRLLTAKSGQSVSGPDALGVFTAAYSITVQNTAGSAAVYGDLIDTLDFPSNIEVISASWTCTPTSGACNGSTATGAGPYTLAASNTAIAANATHTYSIVIRFRYRDTALPAGCAANDGLSNSIALPAGQALNSASNSACLPPPAMPAPALSLIKTAGAPSGMTAGSTISYSFALENTGNVTLVGLVVTDPLLDAPATCAAVSLSPGQTITCTGLRTLTQADIDAGVVNNSATATGTPPAGGNVTTPPSTTTTPLTQNPLLSLVKTAGVPSGNTAGSTIEYSFALTNAGNVTLDGLLVNDALLDAPATCAVVTLLPGESTTCTGLRTLTQADFNAGKADNTATATGTTPTGGSATSTPSTTTTPLTQNSGLTLVKTAGVPSGDAAGSTITFNFALTNTGNITLDGLIVNDPLLDAPATCAVVTLLPGESTTCTGLRTLTQADFDKAALVNTATVTGRTPSGDPITSPPSTTTTPLTQTPLLSLVKTAGVPSGNTAGSTIEYSFALTNAGNVTLNGLLVNDALLDAPATCAVVTLLPGESTTCTGLRTLTQADFNAGKADNTATATSSTPTGGSATSTPSTTTTPLSQSPALSLIKTAGVPSGAYAGSTIEYNFAVTNSGNVTLDGLLVSDPLLDAPAVCAVVSLLPGESTTCTGLRTLTQQDIDSGKLTNTATVTGAPPSGDPVASPPSTTTTPLVQNPALDLVKTAGAPSGNTVGSTIEYSFALTNSGNVTLSGLIVNDDLLDAPATCAVVTLLPGESTTCTGLRTLTQADFNAGQTQNTATVTGAPPTGDPIASPPSSTVTIHELTPSLTIDKVPLQPSFSTPGEVVDFEFRVTNTGNVTITDLIVVDGKIMNITCPVTTLAPGETVVCTASYVVTQDDIEAGEIGGTAIADGTPAAGVMKPAEDTEVIEAVLTPALVIEKTATLTRDALTIGMADAGDEITYAIVVTNTGNIIMSDVTVNDIYQGGQPRLLNCVPVVIAPGERSICDPYVHLVTREEARQGGLLENIAEVSTLPARGTDPNLPGTPITGDTTSTDKTLVPVADPNTTLRVIKSAAPRDVRVGDIVRYSVVIENIGQTHASDVTLYDMPPAGFTLVENSLTVADKDNKGRLVGSRPFRVDQIDVDAGERASVTYLLRVGAGVRPGVHVNEAHSQERDNISNTATAEVRLVGDPLMDESLIVGTVFDDRDADGWQDTAHLDDIRIAGGLDASVLKGPADVIRDGQAYGQGDLSQGVALGHIPARQSIADAAPRVVISQLVSEPRFNDSFSLTNRQGLTLNMAADGAVTRTLSGDAKRGLTSADPAIERRVSATDGGYRVDYIITNNGIDERGIAGVRIASVEGLLIETDPYGRYHLVGVEGGSWERGRNFILSVDPSSLPQGAVFTTDNPKLRRVTPGLPVRFDFGVQLPVEIIGGGVEEVVMKLAEVVFAPGSAEVRELYGNVLDHMAREIKARGAGDIIITANGETRDLAYARAVAVRAAMASRLTAEELSKLTVTVQTDREDAQNWVAKITDAPVLGQVLFDTDKSEVKPEFSALLDEVARTLDAAHAEAGSEIVIRLVGHTDVRASDAYNLKLGLRRAQAVFEALASRLSPEFRSKLRVEITNEAPASAAAAGR